jgi:hypothetical protein
MTYYRRCFTQSIYGVVSSGGSECKEAGMRKEAAVAYFVIYLNCKWVFTRWQCTTIRHNTQITHITQITHHTQTKHSTQNDTNNKGHTTHNEYNYNCNRWYNPLIFLGGTK